MHRRSDLTCLDEALGVFLGGKSAHLLDEAQLRGVMSRDILHLPLLALYGDENA